jgi:hypothetical protein
MYVPTQIGAICSYATTDLLCLNIQISISLLMNTKDEKVCTAAKNTPGRCSLLTGAQLTF